jgi:hypothetical protein
MDGSNGIYCYFNNVVNHWYCFKIKEKMTERDCTEKRVVQNESPFNICSFDNDIISGGLCCF